MTSAHIYLITGIVLWALGLFGFVLIVNRLRRIIALNIMSSGVFMLMVAIAARSSPTDPVLQALVLTGLVVAISATAFALRLGSAHTRHGPPSRKKDKDVHG